MESISMSYIYIYIYIHKLWYCMVFYNVNTYTQSVINIWKLHRLQCQIVWFIWKKKQIKRKYKIASISIILLLWNDPLVVKPQSDDTWKNQMEFLDWNHQNCMRRWAGWVVWGVAGHMKFIIIKLRHLESPGTHLFVEEFLQVNNKEIIKTRNLLALCERNPPMTVRFFAHGISKAESISMSWHHDHNILLDNIWSLFVEVS